MDRRGQTNVPLNGLSAYDFIPRCLRADSLFHWPEFENFSTLIEPINAFLATNPSLSVKSCETVHLRVQADHIKKPDKSSFIQFGDSLSPFVKGARLWIANRCFTQSHVPVGTSEQIGLVTFIPKLHKNEEDTLEELVDKVNEYLQTSPLPGKLIAVESLLMGGLTGGQVDVDASCWKPSYSLASFKSGFMRFFRIWYRIGLPERETIGIADFYPAQLKPAGLFNRPKYQHQPQVMSNIGAWVPANVSILNINTLDIHVKENGTVRNAHKTFYWDYKFRRYYLRFIRVVYVNTRDPSTGLPPHEPLPTAHRRKLTCVLFAPDLIRDDSLLALLKHPKFEGQAVTRARLDAWITGLKRGVRLVAVETVVYKTRSGAELKHGLDVMFTWNEATDRGVAEDEQHLICYRVYADDDDGEWNRQSMIKYSVANSARGMVDLFPAREI